MAALLLAEQEHAILFRCDGTWDTGLGHVSRSLALAEALVDAGCRCVFVGRFDIPAQRLLDAGRMPWTALNVPEWTHDDAMTLVTLANGLRVRGVVLDSYELNAEYVERVQRSGTPVVLIDDFAALPRYPCSAIVNFTSRAPDLPYPAGGVRKFLGLQWFLARRRLRALRAAGPRLPRPVSNVLVAPGGSDPHGIASSAVQSMRGWGSALTIHAVIPEGHPERAALEVMLGEFADGSRTLTNLPDLAGELAWADACISGAGLTKYEAAFVGVPAAVLSQNEGQARDTERFAELGMTLDLGLAAFVIPERIRRDARRLVEDTSQREALTERGLALFPTDPTQDLALMLLGEVMGRE